MFFVVAFHCHGSIEKFCFAEYRAATCAHMPIKVRKQFLKNKAKERLTPAEADLIAKVNSLATSWSQRMVKWKRGVKAGEPILVASDCSGYGSDLIALTLLGLRNSVKSVLVCDKDPIKRMLHEAVVESCGIAVSKTAQQSATICSLGTAPRWKARTFTRRAIHAQAILIWERNEEPRMIEDLRP